MKLTYDCFSFDELPTIVLYKLLQLRMEVFVVEQECPYQDCDDKDQESYHVLGVDEDGVLQACTRLVPPGGSYDGYSSIGRVVTSAAARGLGLGKLLMVYSIEKTKFYWPDHRIKISAQVYASRFYSDLGFQAVGKEYLEDDIPHVAMILDNGL